MDRNIFFTIFTAKELFDKCKYEFSKISEIEINTTIYHLLNICLSLNHLLEWYLFGDYEDSSKILCIKYFYPYKSGKYVKNESKCKKFNTNPKYPSINNFISTMNLNDFDFKVNTKQKLIRQISNHIKHINFQIISSLEKSYTCCLGDFQLGESQLGQFNGYLYYVIENNNKIDLLVIIKDLLNEWDIFLNGNPQ